METLYPILLNFAVALGLGALLGADREVSATGRRSNGHYAGLRSYMLISVLGFFAAYFAKTDGALLAITIGFFTLIFIVLGYLYDAWRHGFYRITTELSLVVVFVAGFLSFTEPFLATVLGVVAAAILGLKQTVDRFMAHINREELFATLKFLVITALILPLLPDRALDSWGIFNPHETWLIIVFISGLSFVGYILTKVIGANRGILLTGLVGGLMSSTAVTTSMAQASKRNRKIIYPFVLAVLGATLIQFARVLIVVAVLNPKLALTLVIPLTGMFLGGLAYCVWLWLHQPHRQAKQTARKGLAMSSPFQFVPALKFGVFYLFILAFAALMKRYFGDSGVYLASFASGFADVDAITVSLSRLNNGGEIVATVATTAIVIAVMMNNCVKFGISFFFGGAEFRRLVARGFSAIILAGVLALGLI